MTIQFPDIASYEAGVSLAGLPAVIVKATEDGGDTADRYVNPDFARARADAAARAVFLIAYHFLRKDNPAAEADFALSVIGAGVPSMVDAEASGVNLADILAFAREYNTRGGRLVLVYLPHWYWIDLGSPDLTPLTAAGIHLISSNYPGSYSDDGPGWQPYGGVTPLIWQWTSSARVNGVTCDMNAFKGTVQDLAAILTGAAAPAATDTYRYRATHNTHTPIAVDGRFGPLSTKALQYVVGTAVDGGWGPDSIRHLQAMLGVAVDGRQGPITIKELQARVGAAQDGAWGTETTTAVQRHLNAGTLY